MLWRRQQPSAAPPRHACVQEAAELQRGVKELEAQRTQLLREAKLQGEMEEQYARRGTLQVRSGGGSGGAEVAEVGAGAPEGGGWGSLA